MASPSVTNIFSNGTTADASQVNTDFTDIINGITDGTKDLSISALTCAGAATFNGNVTIGNGAVDDLTITASLASSVAIKTTFSYDVGSSTVGLKSIYFGSDDSAAKTTRVIAGTVGTSYTITLPPATASVGQRLRANASSTLHFVHGNPFDRCNMALAATVAANALTITVKGFDGSDASATSPIDVGFRNATAATGTPQIRQITGALSLVISSGSTLGHTSSATEYIFVYLIDNAGTLELAASSAFYNDGSVQSTTAEGGAGAADSATAIYSTTTRSNVAIRLVGRMKSVQSTAGTWASAPSEISLHWDRRYTMGSVQVFSTPGTPTWTRPSGCLAVMVEAWGGGGGGGGAEAGGAGSAAAGGSGGGGGGYSRKWISVGLGATETVTVGAAGTAGAAAGGGDGGAGGNTSFGSHVTANGGAAGQGDAAAGATNHFPENGGLGGSASGGDLNISGQAGVTPTLLGATPDALGGVGGDSPCGGPGGGARLANNAGLDGSTPGGGGSGGCAAGSTTDRAGGAGGAGMVIVYEYY